jgi:8-oxo-dGTP pyrophosphatase MutT (NUDIX family)
MSSPETPVRDAATVALLRDGVTGIEAWLLTRAAAMVFAAGMSVFPGGRVDDADAALPIAGGDLEDVAARFGCDLATARGLVGAGVRETFEETGVLLSVPVAELSGARADVEAGRVGFGELLAANGVAVDGAALRPWARWITPPNEVRRYDTHFFVAALPPSAVAQDVTTESSAASWVPVAEALAEARAGRRGLMPPTLATLTSLLEFATVADVLAAAPARDLTPVRPRVLIEGDTVAIELPDGTRIPIPARPA